MRSVVPMINFRRVFGVILGLSIDVQRQSVELGAGTEVRDHKLTTLSEYERAT